MKKILFFFALLISFGQMEAQTVTANPTEVVYGDISETINFTVLFPPAGTVRELRIFLSPQNLTTPALIVTLDCSAGFACTGSMTVGTTLSGAEIMIDDLSTSFLAVLYVDGVQINAAAVINGSLPVTMKSFAGKAMNNEVVLDWSTSSEVNNDFFTVERSFDNATFRELEDIAGAGSTDQEQTYNFLDKDVMRNTSSNSAYYRIKQTDFDGQFSYSQVISVDLENRQSLDITNITANDNTVDVTFSANEGQAQISIYTVNGQLVEATQVEAIKGFNTTSINLSGLQQGMYILHINDGVNQVVSKFFN